MSSDDAVRAGIASLMRKAATPARTSRMKMPEPLAAPEKMRSPGRRATRCCDGGSVGAFVAVTVAPGNRWRVRGVRRAPGAPGAPRRPPGGGGGRRGAPGGAPARRRELGSAGGDGVDGGLALLADGVRDRRVAGVVGGGLLAVLADHVRHEGLDVVGRLLVVVGDAADVVADE